MDMIVMVKFELPTAGMPGAVSLSDTCKVTVVGAASAVGVPEMTQGTLELVQVVGSRLRPAGKAPLLTLHV